MIEPYLSPDAMEAIKKRRALLALEKAEEIIKKTKRSPAAEYKERVRAGEGKKKETGDMYKPGGKKLHPVAAHIKALYDIDPDSVTKEQKKQYKKITGEELKQP